MVETTQNTIIKPSFKSCVASQMSKVQPAAGHWTVDQENLGMNMFGEQKNKERNSKNSFKGKYFEWIIKQLLNLAFVG